MALINGSFLYFPRKSEQIRIYVMVIGYTGFEFFKLDPTRRLDWVLVFCESLLFDKNLVFVNRLFHQQAILSVDWTLQKIIKKEVTNK